MASSNIDNNQIKREINDALIEAESEGTETDFGDMDWGGFLDNLFRKGFTPLKCLSELHANSLDAKASHILYEILRDFIKIIDGGKGMNRNGVKKMFSIYRANHTNERSLGVSGFGAKPSLAILSKKKSVTIFTHSEDDEYLCITVPWDAIFETREYKGMIKVRLMTDEQIEIFQNERREFGKTTGTTICFPHNSLLEDAIKKNFEELSNMLPHPQDCLSNIYGKFRNTTVTYKHFEKISRPPLVLRLYDYFEGENNEFYTGKRRDSITVYKKEDEVEPYRFIWENSVDNCNYEIIRKGTGWAKEPTKMITNLNQWESIGVYTVVVGNRIDDKYFNSASTILPKADVFIYQYDQSHGLTYQTENGKHELSSKNFEYLCKPKTIRNYQVIGTIELPGMSISSARANGEAMHLMYHTRCEVSYLPVSSHKNELDLIAGVQENKNQYICNMPIQMLRLVKAIKTAKHNEIWSSFKATVLSNYVPVIVVPPILHLVANLQEQVEEEEVVVIAEEEILPNVIGQEEQVEVQEEEIEEVLNEVAVNEVAVNEVVVNLVVEDVQEEEIEEVLNEVTVNEVVLNEVEENTIVEPTIVPVVATNHLTITVSNGLHLLNKWNNSHKDTDILDKTIEEMIFKYQSKCAPDQVDDFLILMNRDQKYTMLINIIIKKYPENHQMKEMLFGAELYRLYLVSFPNDNL